MCIFLYLFDLRHLKGQAMLTTIISNARNLSSLRRFFHSIGFIKHSLSSAFLSLLVCIAGFSSQTVFAFAPNDLKARADSGYETIHGTAIQIPFSEILNNDSGDGIILDTVSRFRDGDVSKERGHVEFTPDYGFHGNGVFFYTIKDDHGNSDTASVVIKVNHDPNNTGPVAIRDDLTVPPGQSRIISHEELLKNDRDADGDHLVIIGYSEITDGELELGRGKVTFTPDEGVSSGRFRYEIDDGKGESSRNWVNI